MKILVGVVLLCAASIDARGTPKIQVYEIREKGNGIELKDLSSIPNTQQKIETQLLRLLSPNKQSKGKDNVTQNLIENLKALKGEEGNRISDDAFIYILNDIFNGNHKSSSSSEEVFVDKTRDERPERIINILENLLRKKPKNKKRSQNASTF